jgi:8-hydroxy-5-deazaflavin:NADPH oxidoreductase
VKVAIIGSGSVGTSLAQAITGAGHDVIVASASHDDLDRLVQEVDVATASSNAEAVKDADAVVIAVPFTAVEGIVNEIPDRFADKIIIDVTNPLTDDLSGLVTNAISAAELVQKYAPNARVVKAFNTVFASNQAQPDVDGTQLDGFVAGDDEEAKRRVTALLEKIGYRPIDVGSLVAARYLEGMAFLNISLNKTKKWSWRSGWKLVGPTS